MKLTTLDVDLQSPIGAEFFKQTAPIPAIGFAGRGYLTQEPGDRFGDSRSSAFRRACEEQLDGDGSYNDFDSTRTYNFNKYVGAQARLAQDDDLLRDDDLPTRGDLKFTGLYFGGVVRY